MNIILIDDLSADLLPITHSLSVLHAGLYSISHPMSQDSVGIRLTRNYLDLLIFKMNNLPHQARDRTNFLSRKQQTSCSGRSSHAYVITLGDHRRFDY